MTTDYNDGKWHDWNGADCPVHPKTVVRAVFGDTADRMDEFTLRGQWLQREAGQFQPECWFFRIEAFCVVKEYRETREFWITLYDGMAWDTQAQAEKRNDAFGGGAAGPIMHVREVVE